MKIVVIVVLIAVVGVVFALKQQNKASVSEPIATASPNPATITDSNKQNLENTQKAEITAKLPRLVDLGADKCIPCKMMAPILEEMRTTYKDKLVVDFIDVWKNPPDARKYNISVIPTQIFYDALGKELFRHENYFAKENIIAKWKEFGVDLNKPK